MTPDTMILILASTLLASGALLSRLPVGTCASCAHCAADRRAREREAEAQSSRFYGIPICRSCGRYHAREEDHRY